MLVGRPLTVNCSNSAATPRGTGSSMQCRLDQNTSGGVITMLNQRTEDEMLAEIETANDGAGPDPVATFEGPALAAILAALRDRNDAQARIDAAVAQARSEGASWTAIGAMLGVSRQAALKRYRSAA